MFSIHLSNQYVNDPWNMTYSERIRHVRQYIANGNKIQILIYENADTSTFRYRCYNIFQSLNENDCKWKAMYFFQNELEFVSRLLNDITMVTIVRYRWTRELEAFVDLVKSKGIKVLFDIDDMVFNLDYLPLITNTLNVGMREEADYSFWFSYIGRLGASAKLADGYVTSNQYLADKLSDTFHKPSYIIPNFLNREQMERSHQCMTAKKVATRKKEFSIGYFSGTPSHINDFKIVSKSIFQLLDEFDNMRLDVVGFMEFPNEAQKYIQSGKIRFTSLVDFIRLQDLVAQVDVNIVPLVENTFTNCKSELKYFEAGIVNTITCATPTYTYKTAITDGENGLLCKPSEWYQKIKDIYLGNYDTEQICKNAYEHSTSKYYGSYIVDLINHVYETIYEC